MDESSAEGRRQRFGRLLGETLGARGWSHDDLATALEFSEVVITAWVRGEVEPPASCVMWVEQVLGVSPGQLCSSLGYLPYGVPRPMTVLEAIRASQEIDDDLKPMLVAGAMEIIKRSRPSPALHLVRPPDRS